jgi:hypothetical protein
LREFFECAPYGFIGHRPHVPEFDHPICQQPHAPALPALRRIRAREGDQLSLGSPIHNPSAGSSGLLWHKGHFKALLTQAPALAGYRSGGNLKGLCDPLVGPAIWSISIGLEQDSSVEQLAGVSPAAAHERFEFAALPFGEAEEVPLVHSEPPSWRAPTERVR